MTQSSNSAVSVERRYRSGNFNQRRRDQAQQTLIDMVIIHYTDMASCEAAIARLCDPEAEISAHYVISAEGTIFALIDEQHRAWHAGVAEWQGSTNINDRSIGIELDYPGHSASPGGVLPDYPQPQISSLLELLADILCRHAISPTRVLGHEDVSPTRKIDPGPKFPWPKLAAAGVALR